MKKAWTQNGVVCDVAHTDPYQIYVPEIAALYTTDVPDSTVSGATQAAGVWTNPPPPPPPDPTVVAAQSAAVLAAKKASKNLEINQWRATANQTFFTHAGKQIACDALSRSDIDAVAGSISMDGVFPAGFPGAWKALDNSLVMLPNIAAFKLMYASMTTQGSINFGKSQTLKTQLATATTAAQVAALVWP